MKAIIGSWDQRPYRLLAEATALRAKVADLEAELQVLREENAALRAAVADHEIGDMEVVLSGT